MNDSYSILIIEDEKNILDFMSRTLKANGYKTTTVTSGKAGLSIINSIHVRKSKVQKDQIWTL